MHACTFKKSGKFSVDQRFQVIQRLLVLQEQNSRPGQDAGEGEVKEIDERKGRKQREREGTFSPFAAAVIAAKIGVSFGLPVPDGGGGGGAARKTCKNVTW